MTRSERTPWRTRLSVRWEPRAPAPHRVTRTAARRAMTSVPRYRVSWWVCVRMYSLAKPTAVRPWAFGPGSPWRVNLPVLLLGHPIVADQQDAVRLSQHADQAAQVELPVRPVQADAGELD